MDDFLEHDQDKDEALSMLREITGYNPANFKNERFDDRSMVSDFRTMQKEEYQRYVYIYVCIYVCMYVCMYVFMYVNVCMHVC